MRWCSFGAHALYPQLCLRVRSLGERLQLHQAWLHLFSNENNKKRELELNSVSAYTLLRRSFVQKGQGIISVLFHKEPRFLLWLNTRSHKSQREDEEEEELVKKGG